MKRSVMLMLNLIFVAVISVSSVEAETVVHYEQVGEDWIATGISGLEIGSNVYNVEWIWDSFDDIYGSGNASQFSTFTQALSATNTVNQVLSTASPFPINIKAYNVDDTGWNYFASYYTAYGEPSVSGTINALYSYSDNVSSWLRPSWGHYTFYTYDTSPRYLYFTAVPIPGAVWLLGSGLIGIAGVRRKLKK